MQGSRPREPFSASSARRSSARNPGAVLCKCRSLDSLRSLGMTTNNWNYNPVSPENAAEKTAASCKHRMQTVRIQLTS